MQRNRFLFVYFLILAISFSFLLLSCNSQQSNNELTEAEMLERGEFLVTIGGCDDCHTPKNMGPNGPELDMNRRLSGHPEGTRLVPVDTTLIGPWIYMSGDLTAAVGPWGVSFSLNLTPDNETGIGTWQPEMFINAMRTGKHLGVAEGRPILPPMPWQGLSNLPEQELRSIFAYLKSLKPIKNRVPAPLPPGQIPTLR